MGIVMIIVAIAVAIVLLFFIVQQISLLKLIEDTPTSPIGKVMGGLAEIKGKIISIDTPIIAPLSKKPCVYLHLIIEELRRSGKNSRWVTIKETRRVRHFELDDGTGRALVELTQAQVDFEVDSHRSSGFLSDAPPDFKEVLATYGLSAQGFLFNNNYRCSETILEEGDELYILGEPDMKGDKPFFNGSQGQTFFVSDKDEETLTNGLVWKIFGETMAVIFIIGLAVFSYSRMGRF